MTDPKTELIAPLRLGAPPNTQDQAPLAAILAHQNGELAAKDLWQRHGGEIEAFYTQLKLEELIYLALPSAEMSRLRVAERVRHGGHDIPANDIIRRFPRSLHNMLHLFSPLADQTRCFMNHGDIPELVFRQQAGQREIFHAGFFEFFQQEAQK